MKTATQQSRPYFSQLPIDIRTTLNIVVAQSTASWNADELPLHLPHFVAWRDGKSPLTDEALTEIDEMIEVKTLDMLEAECCTGWWNPTCCEIVSDWTNTFDYEPIY